MNNLYFIQEGPEKLPGPEISTTHKYEEFQMTFWYIFISIYIGIRPHH